MTGELFALLKAHSLLAAQLDGPVTANPEFLAGVEEARRGDLLASLFGVRAAAVLGPAEAGGAPPLSAGSSSAPTSARGRMSLEGMSICSPILRWARFTPPRSRRARERRI